MTHPARRIMLAVLAMLCGSLPASAQLPMTLNVDASQARMKILHASLSMPARPGPLTLVYPKWIPGEHMPSGPIANLTGLHIFADGAELQWRRDLVEMNAFHVAVPGGARAVTATYDYVVPTGGGAFGANASANAKCAIINWNTVVLSPAGENPDAVTLTASLKLPGGWKEGGALDIARVDGDTVHFAPTSLTLLIDHPVVLGEYLKTIVLWPAGSEVGEHVIDVIADSEWALQFPQSRIDAYKRLVREERGVFGGVGHYRKYHWLLTLSDSLGSYGVEHHETADDRVAENTFVDDEAAKRSSLLLPHEFFHSWNGKTRRPAGLVTGGYEQPMRGDLLWVYEGLTNYYGELLSARAGLIGAEEWMDELAADAMAVSPTGRTWRPLQDTADSAPFLYTSGGGWSGWRRSTDFYKEGSLIWLEADVTIRELTGGRKSLDDFCALFHGENDNGRIYVKPYEAKDVYAALNQVAPYTWSEFFEKRLTSKSAELPLGGAAKAGYRLVYTEKPNIFLAPWALDGGLNAIASLGIHVMADGTVDDAVPGTPAYRGGVSNGMKIVAVNSRRFSIDELTRAIGASTGSKEPMEFILDNGGYFSVNKVDYHGGLQYPHFERIGGVADLLSAIAQPRLK
jgi:predicted metalloprotease with PDZ domain